MTDYLIQFVKSLIALFIITDSVGNLPFFIGLTEGASTEERRKIFRSAALTGFLLLVVFLFAGTAVLDLFKVTLNDFQIAGGILLLLISVEIMLRGKVNIEHKEEVGVVPMGCPLLVGPGAITTAMMLLKIYDYPVVLAAIFVCF
ncbi:MarC family protein, partial [Candidatus Saganbacteria bacterium]|nr:MarC family protein [Candidatus Saganbacteria bacterium]